MKKIILAACAALLGLGTFSVGAMDSATLRSHPEQYRILSMPTTRKSFMETCSRSPA